MYGRGIAIRKDVVLLLPYVLFISDFLHNIIYKTTIAMKTINQSIQHVYL